MDTKLNRTQRSCLAVFLIITILLAIVVGGVVLIKEKYPLKYEDLICEYSETYNIEPEFLAAVMATESTFNEKAESNKGAKGLMQIMPKTGEWIANKIHLKGFQEDMLFEPEVSIEMGAWYLNYLEGKFKELDTAIAAYNAGPATVEQWLEEACYSEDGTTLSEIPYEETAHYVKKVKLAYEVYKRFYRFS